MKDANRQKLDKLLRLLAHTRNSEQAWRELFAILWPFVFTGIYRVLTGQIDLSKEASQEVFHRLIRYCDFQKLKTSDDFLPYLTIMVRNVARDYLSRTLQYTEDLIHDEHEIKSTEGKEAVNPEQVARMVELMRTILDGLDKEGTTLVHLLAEGYTVSEIAKRLEISYSNAAVRIYRLRQRLRKSLISKGIIAPSA